MTVPLSTLHKGGREGGGRVRERERGEREKGEVGREGGREVERESVKVTCGSILNRFEGTVIIQTLCILTPTYRASACFTAISE